MKVEKATNYGFRTVIRLVENDQEPEWVHFVGEPLRDAHGLVVLDAAGKPVLITSPIVPRGETGETCHNCHSNWRTREVIFDGEDQFFTSATGTRQRKTPMMLAEEALALVAPPAWPVPLAGVVGLRI